MSLSETLLPVAVLLPLGAATLMLALAHWLPPRMPKIVAILVALAVCAICLGLAHASLDGPVRHWFGLGQHRLDLLDERLRLRGRRPVGLASAPAGRTGWSPERCSASQT